MWTFGKEESMQGTAIVGRVWERVAVFVMTQHKSTRSSITHCERGKFN